MKSAHLPADDSVLYEAYAARDRRFDGAFFVAVASTRIYCRPICPARTARKANCTFFVQPAQAEAAGYRPCRRCRPERAPGMSTADAADGLIRQVAARVSGDEGSSPVAVIARDLHVSPRQLRRVVHRELGVTPIEMVLTHRLLIARRLLSETDLSVTEIATGSGFSSVRRFNDAFLKRYGSSPTALRREQRARGATVSTDSLTIELPYRPPYDWCGILDFLKNRALRGVEVVRDDSYSRSVAIGGRIGWLRVGNSQASPSLRLEVSASLVGALPTLLDRVTSLFDLEADPGLIGAHLQADPLLGPTVAAIPGLRVPGAFDGFELALRAILGQQITVRAAATLSGRLAEHFGAPTSSPFEGLDRISPAPETLAGANPGDLVQLGITRSRAETLIELSRRVAEGRLLLAPAQPVEETLRALQQIRGIGPWTAQYVAMRALGWPDAFPKEDIVLRQRLGGVTPAAAEARSSRWRPWRSYATMYLWRMGGPT